MKKNISSDMTIIYKIVFPIFWSSGFSMLPLVDFCTNSNSKWETLLVFLVGSVWLFSDAFNLKFVEIDGDYLVIKNFRKTIRVPTSQIDYIRKSLISRPTQIWIHFKDETDFGMKILFMPKSSGLFDDQHPVINELNSLIADTKKQMFQIKKL